VSRILLLEDDPELGAQLCAQLREVGYEVVWWRATRSSSPDRR
jgi:DNA-binding response OmpR family regulator